MMLSFDVCVCVCVSVCVSVCACVYLCVWPHIARCILCGPILPVRCSPSFVGLPSVRTICPEIFVFRQISSSRMKGVLKAVCGPSKVRRTVGPSERAPQTDIKLTNERSRVVDLGRGHHDAKDAPRVWPDALPLCRLPRARPNLTKPVTALLPSYVPICAKQIWMENSSGRRQESQEYRIHL